MTATTASHIQAILFAAIESRPGDRRGTSAGKAHIKLLLVILLHFNREPMSLEQLADLTGCCGRSVWLALKALAKQGLISVTACGHGKYRGRIPNAYSVNMEAVRSLARVKVTELVPETPMTDTTWTKPPKKKLNAKPVTSSLCACQ